MAFTSETVSKGHVYSDTVTTDVGDVVLSGGTMLIEAGAIATSTTVNADGVLIVEAGGTELGLTNSGTVNGSGGVISGPLLNSGLVEASGTDAYLAIVGSGRHRRLCRARHQRAGNQFRHHRSTGDRGRQQCLCGHQRHRR